jgi:Uma2 family endonuclease
MHEPTDLLEPDDLLQMPDGDSYELVDGRLVEKHMGAESDRIAVRLASKLDQHCSGQGVGFVFGSQTGYRCFPNRPRMVRKPDVSVVVRGRFADEQIPKGDISLAPDLVVESVSPNDTYEEIEVKVMEYLRAGVRLVWVISPEAQTVLIRRPDKSAATLEVSDKLDGEKVIPGFSCPVADLFA